jgi:Tol biopolymer transport system component/DNA-binding winged helix-turn-helix (wHTH) protein
MVKSQIHLYRFGKFQLDTLKRVLLCNNTPVQLPSRAFDVLLALVEHNQSVIDKDELMRLVWRERVVEENNLTRHISTLRKVLDETPNDHRYIVTVPGRGYNFVADVEKLPLNDVENPSLDDKKRAGSSDLLREPESGQSVTMPIKSSPPTFGSSSHNLRRRVLLATIILACTGLLGLGLLAGRSKHSLTKPYRDWEVIRLTRTGGSIVPAISRDGSFVAYVNRESGRESVWIVQLATSVQQQIVGPENFAYFDLDFSPDGSELFFTRREGQGPQLALYRIPMLGGVPTKLRDDVDSQVTVSPDGAHLAFVRANKEGKSEFVITKADGAEERVLIDHGIQFPEWSPDGNVIAYSVGDAGTGADRMSMHEVRVSDGVEREISSRRWVFAGHKSWLPDGSGLIISARAQKSTSTQLWFLSYPSGEAHELSRDLDDFMRARLTNDGRELVAEQVKSTSDIWDGPLSDMAQAKKIGVWGRSGLAFDAGGRVVYSSLQSGEVGKIWVMSVDGTLRKQLTSDDANDISPVPSPDGRYIVFCSNRSGNHEIWRVNVDGSNLVQLTTSNGATRPNISPDGKWVIYLTTEDGILRRVPIEGGQPQAVAGKAVGMSAVSPDGKMIAYFAQGKQTWEIAVNSLETGSLVRTFKIGSHSLNNASLKWRPDGRGLLYAASTDGVGNIWLQPLDGSAPNQVTDFKGDVIFSFDVSTDGEELVCARGGWQHDIVLIKNLR